MSTKLYGALAQFESASAVFHACEKVRDARYDRWDAHTPFPVHGLDKAMGLPRSKLPFLVFGAGMTGVVAAVLLQYWTAAVDYKVIIAAKPYFSWQAFVPVTFEVAVLLSAGAAVVFMLFINRLPMWHHPLLTSERFKAASDDKFFISIEAADSKFDEAKTVEFLKEIGATHVELVEA
ncbi:MAG: DUF3341 domain-containing protein [Deltaproteobacteria bacterium]